MKPLLDLFRAVKQLVRGIVSRELRRFTLESLRCRLSHDDATALVSSEFRFQTLPNMLYPDYAVDEDVVRAGVLVAQGRWNDATLLANGLLAADPQSPSGLDLQRTLEFRLRPLVLSPTGRGGWLVIRACGIGFWGEVNHVISHALLAQLTNRVPVVYWGPECLYSSGKGENAFLGYFEPLGGPESRTLPENLTYFPGDFWSAETVFGPGVRESVRGKTRSWSGLEFLSDQSDVWVADRYADLEAPLSWLPQGHPLFGKSRAEAFRWGYSQFFRKRTDVSERIEAFWSSKMAGRSWVAVHARGGDRTESLEKLRDNNQRYYQVLESQLEPGVGIFLCTDSREIHAEFCQQYGERVLSYDSQRTSGSEGVHVGASTDRFEAGLETVIEVELAARCDRFVGCRSNVSGAIFQLGRWKSHHLFLDLPSQYL